MSFEVDASIEHIDEPIEEEHWSAWDSMPDTQTAASAPSGDHRHHSISAKIIFLVFLCTFSTALVTSWIAIHATHAQLRRQIDTGFPMLLERSRTELTPWSLGRLPSARAVARQAA